MSGVRGRRQHSAAATAPLPEGRNRRGGGAGRGVGRDTDGSGGRAMGAAQGMKRGAHLSRSPEPAEDAAAAAAAAVVVAGERPRDRQGERRKGARVGDSESAAWGGEEIGRSLARS